MQPAEELRARHGMTEDVHKLLGPLRVGPEIVHDRTELLFGKLRGSALDHPLEVGDEIQIAFGAERGKSRSPLVAR